MASNVDVTIPADGEKVSKAEMREQFRVINEEISDLQRKSSVPGLSAFGDTPTREEVETMVRVINNRFNRLGYQTAMGLIGL